MSSEKRLSIDELENLYQTNEHFKTYIDKSLRISDLDRQTIFEYAIVQDVAKSYMKGGINYVENS